VAKWQTRYFEVVVPQGMQVQVLPCAPQIIGLCGDAAVSRTISAQDFGSGRRKPKGEVKFPFVIKHRDSKVTIYGRGDNYRYYRLKYRVNGEYAEHHFKTFTEAKIAGEKAVRDISSGNTVVAALSSKDANALRYAREKLADLALALNLAKPDPNTPDAAFKLEDAIAEFAEAKEALGVAPSGSSWPSAVIRRHSATFGA
jgi:hypothetical protein